MNLKYTIGAVIIGILFIGGAWLFSDEKPAQNATSQIYQAPQPKPPATGGGDANF